MSRELGYLRDILAAARLVQTAIEGISQEALSRDWMRLSAIERQIEIIGEATKRMPDVFKRAHPEIPWREMAGMRDMLIHSYNELDMDDVWSTAHDDIPKLIALLEPLIPPEE